MSDRDFLDLDDDLLDDGPDAPVGEWDDDLMDDFPADDPAASDEPEAVPAPPPAAAPEASGKPAAATGSKAKAKTKTKTKFARTRPRAAGGGTAGTGVLCFVLVLLSGVTLAAGLMTAVGADPRGLLDFSGFRDPAAIVDFQAHPLNAFWLAAVVTLLAAVMTGVAVTRRMKNLSHSTSSQNEVLEAIRHLDPEKPETWQREELQEDPDLAAVTGALLGHYNLQQAKLQRYVGLEGELHRLEKAMADDSAADLQGNWENPVAGSVADQALRLLQSREAVSRSADENQESLAEQGADLVSGLRDARSWQGTTVDQIKHQGSGVERIFRRLSKLAGAGAADELAPRRERLRQAIVAVRQELESLPTRGSGGDSADANLNVLVERASRLAFQIAMEVARLGAKGERLLPLTQDFEELTTELRALLDRSRSSGGHDEARDQALDRVRGRLAELDPSVLETAGADHGAAVAELAPVAGEVAAGMANLAKNFGVQDNRLRAMLELASSLTGIEVGEGGDPDAAPGSGILVDSYDPFSSKQDEGGLVADPFASRSEHSIFDTESPQSNDFARSVLPGAEDELQTMPDPAGAFGDEAGGEPASPSDDEFGLMGGTRELVLEDTPPASPPPPVEPVEAAATPAATTPAAAPPAATAPATPPLATAPADGADGQVYELSDFDALSLDDAQPAAPAAEQEHIYELSELGAVKIG